MFESGEPRRFQSVGTGDPKPWSLRYRHGPYFRDRNRTRLRFCRTKINLRPWQQSKDKKIEKKKIRATVLHTMYKLISPRLLMKIVGTPVFSVTSLSTFTRSEITKGSLVVTTTGFTVSVPPRVVERLKVSFLGSPPFVSPPLLLNIRNTYPGLYSDLCIITIQI